MNIHLRRLERRFDLKAYLAQYKPREVGGNWAITCPVCEKEDKLYVLIEDKQTADGLQPRGSFICYYCNDTDGEGAGRGVLSLVEWMEDLGFHDAVKFLAAGGSSGDVNFTEAVEQALTALEGTEAEASADLPTVALPESFTRITEKNAPAYLHERGISVERAQRYGLGFCKTGKMRNRLVVPVYLAGRLVGYQARWMAKEPPRGVKKTRFPFGAKMGNVLFNYDEVKKCKRVILVEDPWSAIRIGRNGTTGFGTKLSAEQFSLLLQTEARELVVIWDQDAIAKANKLALMLSRLWKVRIVELPTAKDPDEHTVTELREMIAGAQVVSSAGAFSSYVRARLECL